MLTVNIKSKLNQILKQASSSPEVPPSEENLGKSTTSQCTEKTRNKGRKNRNTSKKSGREQRSSRSRSSCEAGCLRKLTIRNSIKCKKKTKQTNQIRTQSQTKLHNAIQKFYTNLSTMPLDILITHTNPEDWLQEQHETCKQLKNKLEKLYLSEGNREKQNVNQINKGRKDGYLYYRSKLEAVSGVLTNIENNIGMLSQLYRQELKSYASNSSLNSRVQSFETSPATSKPTQSLKPSPGQVNRPVKQYKKEQSLYEIHDNLNTQMNSCEIVSSNESPESKYKSQSNTGDFYDKMLDQFNSNLNKFAQSRKKVNLPEKESESIAQFLSTCRSEQSPEQEPKMSQERTKRISQLEPESISGLLVKSLVNGNLKDPQQMRTMLKRLANSEPYPAVTVPNLKPLLFQIAELKQELKQKNVQIENLLSTQQELQDIIELYKKSDRQNKESSGYASERIKNLQSLIQKHERQITKYQNIDMEMRQSLKNQAIYVNSLQRQKEEIQERFHEQMDQIRRMKLEQETNKRRYEDELEKGRKREKVAIEKMEIYKQKYYQILHEGELKKMISNGTYAGKTSKIKEIWGILGEHRKGLELIDGERDGEGRFDIEDD